MLMPKRSQTLRLLQTETFFVYITDERLSENELRISLVNKYGASSDITIAVVIPDMIYA